MTSRSAPSPYGRRTTLRALARGAGAVIAGAAIFGWCTADTRTQFMVQATVLPVARFTRLTAPSALEVTPADAARGYVEVSQPTLVSVASNTGGFVLDVHTIVPVLAGISVYGLSGSVTLAGEGGSIVERSRPPGTADLDLTYRLALNPGTVAGRYTWPLQLAVRPLIGR